jgi:hypothetical protein
MENHHIKTEGGGSKRNIDKNQEYLPILDK